MEELRERGSRPKLTPFVAHATILLGRRADGRLYEHKRVLAGGRGGVFAGHD